MVEDRSTVEARVPDLASGLPALQIIIIQGEDVRTLRITQRGRLRIGRASSNEIAIDDASISREHAILEVGDGAVEIEDLGSRNGTRIRGEKLASGERREVGFGQAIELGSISLLVQRAPDRAQKRRWATHGHFEATLEQLCARAHSGSSFAVVRVHGGGDVARDELEVVLAKHLRDRDLVAIYAPGELEILLEDAGEDRARVVRDALSGAFGNRGLRAARATYPADGRTADALLEAAGAAIVGRGGGAGDGDAPPPILLDASMRDLYRIGEKVAQGTISILLLGETGAGKEVLAEALHRASPRAAKPFVRINCAAITETLLESELFGYEKGAFTGAMKTKPGLLEVASGGTVLLDELGELPPALQAKLLRVIEQQQVLRLGGLEPRRIDVRYISATNKNLEEDVLRGTFRRDLYFRLNGVTLIIPSLRERPAEIVPLAERFVAEIAGKLEREVPEISERARTLLLAYAWPGNIRELRNTMERAVLLSGGDSIEAEHLPFDKISAPWPEKKADAGVDDNDERRRIVAALERCAGNQTKAAKVLGISRRTLADKLDKYKIPRPKKEI